MAWGSPRNRCSYHCECEGRIGAPCSIAHCSTSRGTDCAARTRPCLRPTGSGSPAPTFQHLQMSAFSSMCTRALVPRVVMLPRPSQHLDPPAPSGQRSRQLVPRAAARFRPRESLDRPANSVTLKRHPLDDPRARQARRHQDRAPSPPHPRE
jgi:hypothetical protein